MSNTSGAITFLLVDDDHDDAELFSQAVAELDPHIEVCHACDGAQAIDMLKKGLAPSVIFLDINMPKVNGWQCLIQLKQDQLTRSIPAVMYSTSSQPDDKIMAEKLGALDFIVKPNQFNKLKEVVLKVLYEVIGKRNAPAPIENFHKK